MRTNYYVIFFALIFYSFLFSEETNTIITPVLDTKIEKGKNLIFCGTFQLAWDELNQEITPDDIKLEGNPSLVEKLNNGLFSKKSISDKNHVAFAGKATKENLDKLFQKLSKFLKPEEYPNFPLEPSSYFAYSYLTKQLPFKEAFETDLNIEFQNQNISSIVEGFGISNYHSNNSKDTFLSSQLRILDYNNDDDYIIQLISEDSDDELILAKTEPKTSLFKTIRAVQKRIDNGNSSSIKSNEILKIPIIDLEVKHLFKELLEKNFENNNFKQYSIEKALQSIDFRLDEKGASLTSSSE
ncbi:MAG: hypothetical protein U9N34_07395, partial [Candidatus Cloacimonadota bacterium]|nr:hypothetical protein [Candidatus Cloacimonadota bacterium]